jgi:hypothetical protein
MAVAQAKKPAAVPFAAAFAGSWLLQGFEPLSLLHTPPVAPPAATGASGEAALATTAPVAAAGVAAAGVAAAGVVDGAAPAEAPVPAVPREEFDLLIDEIVDSEARFDRKKYRHMFSPITSIYLDTGH